MNIKFQYIDNSGLPTGFEWTTVITPNFYVKENNVEANTSKYHHNQESFLLCKKMKEIIDDDIKKIEDTNDKFSFIDFEKKYLNEIKVSTNRDSFYKYCLKNINFDNFPDIKSELKKELKHENKEKLDKMKEKNLTFNIIFEDFLDININIKITEDLCGKLLKIGKKNKIFNFDKISKELKDIANEYDCHTNARETKDLINMTSHVKKNWRNRLNLF